MASIAPSPALLNARLTSEKLALEERLREVASKYREFEQQNAALTDRVAEPEVTQRDLREHLARLLAAGTRRSTVAPGQGRLFDDSSVDAITSSIERLASPATEEAVAEFEGDEALVPDAEEPEKPGRAKPSRDRKQRPPDESNLRREVHRSELPADARRCPESGVELVVTGVKVTTELGYRSAEPYLIEHHQVAYGPAPEVAR